MNNVLLLVMNGLTYGALLFIVSSGFTLIFGLMRIVNMSHGVFYILGAYVSYTIQSKTGNWSLSTLVGTVAVGLTALVVYQLINRVNGDLPRTLLTVGIAMILADFCLWAWGGLPLTLQPPSQLRKPVIIGNFIYPGFRSFVLVTAIVIGLGLWVLLHHTKFGAVVRAGVDNRWMVAALGINIERIFTLTFLLGGLLAGFGGAIGGSYLAFGPGTDFIILTYALVVVILGGMGSLAGSAVGAIIVGLVDSFGRTYFSELAIFLLSGTLILVLAFRPQGLFGKPG